MGYFHVIAKDNLQNINFRRKQTFQLKQSSRIFTVINVYQPKTMSGGANKKNTKKQNK